MGTALVFSKRKSEFTNAKKHLYQSIDDSIGIRQAYNNLAYLYYYFRAEDQLQELVFEPKAEAFLNGFYKRIVFYRANLWHMYFGHIWSSRLSNISLWAFIGALSILLVWFFYLRRLDVFEPEKWHHVLIILGMSMTTIWLVYPMGDFLRDTLELYPSSDPLIDFVYMVISIGIPEELVKIIPVLIMLRFTKAINEPFDYILYCSISALGFAFIENLGYIRYDSLYNIDARTLMAALGHIGFTSIIGYGLILHRYNRIGNGFVMFIISFVLAAATHAFYDFWLLHEGLYYYDWVTLVFVLIGAHVWHIMANNALNISVFYNPQVVFKRNETKFYIIIGLTAIAMYSFTANSFTRGLDFGYSDLRYTLVHYGSLILFFGYSLSNFTLVRRYLAPIRVPIGFLFPKVKTVENFTGLKLMIRSSKSLRLRKKYGHLSQYFPLKGELIEQFVLDGNLNSYLFKANQEQYIINGLNDQFILVPKSNAKTLNSNKPVLIYLFVIPNENILKQTVVKPSDLIFAGWAVSSRLE
jgi:RsiW-degrading membrane proteinase PrsW (M82 family)